MLILLLVAVASSLFFVFLGMTVANPVAGQLIGSFVALIGMIFSGCVRFRLPCGIRVCACVRTCVLEFVRLYAWWHCALLLDGRQTMKMTPAAYLC